MVNDAMLQRTARIFVRLIGALALIGLLAGRSRVITVLLGLLFLALFAFQLLALQRGLGLRSQYGTGPAARSDLILEFAALVLGLIVLLGGHSD